MLEAISVVIAGTAVLFAVVPRVRNLNKIIAERDLWNIFVLFGGVVYLVFAAITLSILAVKLVILVVRTMS